MSRHLTKMKHIPLLHVNVVLKCDLLRHSVQCRSTLYFLNQSRRITIAENVLYGHCIKGDVIYCVTRTAGCHFRPMNGLSCVEF